MHSSNQVYTIKQALEKAMHFCAYQERNQQEVRKKLKTFELEELEVEEVIAELINQNFLNEERYAKAYVRGKFRINKWGKLKITSALTQKDLSTYCINKGLEEITNDEYSETIKALLSKKISSFTDLDYKSKAKAVNYLMSKGFESNQVWDQLNQITND